MDHLSKERRSANMRAVKDRDTAPERIVRRMVHRMGYRFRLHCKNLIGKPDLVFRGRRAVIFVHGCFWHSHTCKRGRRKPENNVVFWADKLGRNVKRDAEQLRLLKADGWRTLVIWECQLKNERKLVARIKHFLN